MEHKILAISSSLYAFISGLLISVATSAGAIIAFTSTTPPNQAQIIINGIVAFISGGCWFLLSERVSTFNKKVDELAPVIGDRNQTVTNLLQNSGYSLLIIFFLAITTSLAWPFAFSFIKFLWNIC